MIAIPRSFKDATYESFKLMLCKFSIYLMLKPAKTPNHSESLATIAKAIYSSTATEAADLDACINSLVPAN